MISPDKFTDPLNCVVYNSYVLLKLLVKEKKVQSKRLYDYLIKTVGESASVLYVPSMDFLYLLGKIEYNSLDDIVEVKI